MIGIEIAFIMTVLETTTIIFFHDSLEQKRKTWPNQDQGPSCGSKSKKGSCRRKQKGTLYLLFI